MLLALLLAASPASPAETVVSAKRPAACTAAIAVRDHVPLEQRIGTQAFTVPHLMAAYDRHAYITASEVDSGRGAFVAALDEMRRARCVVDLYFLAHGALFVAWVEGVHERPHIRLVYDTGAGDAAQAERWLAAGARSFVAHRGANMAPVFYAFFLPSFLNGARLDDALARANRRTRKTLRALSLEEEQWYGTEAVLFGDPYVIARAPTFDP
jgi:hypothetical protein